MKPGEINNQLGLPYDPTGWGSYLYQPSMLVTDPAMDNLYNGKFMKGTNFSQMTGVGGWSDGSWSNSCGSCGGYSNFNGTNPAMEAAFLASCTEQAWTKHPLSKKRRNSYIENCMERAALTQGANSSSQNTVADPQAHSTLPPIITATSSERDKQRALKIQQSGAAVDNTKNAAGVDNGKAPVGLYIGIGVGVLVITGLAIKAFKKD